MPEKPLIPVTEPTDKKAAAKSAEDGAKSEGSDAKVKRLEGVTSIDEKVFLECEILAHASISRIAAQIAEEVRAAIVGPLQAQGASIILLDDTLISALQLFSSLQLQLALFEKGFDGVAPPKAAAPKRESRLASVPGLSISAVSGAVEGVVDLLGLFRQDTQFFGRNVTIKETALYLEIARALRMRDCNVLYPKLLSFQADEEVQASQVTLSQLFDDVFTARQHAADRLRPLLQTLSGLEQNLIEREREFSAATTEGKKQLTEEIQDLKAELVTARKNLDPDLVLFENTDASWNQLQKALASPDEKTGQIPLQLLSRAAEAVERFKSSPSFYFLYAEAVVAGGTMKVTRNLWRTLFVGDGLQFSGGSVVAYALFDGKARILASGTHRCMTPFQGFPDQAPRWGQFDSF